MRDEERRHRINREIARLTPLQREILEALACGDDENTDEELAQRHGLSPGAIRTERTYVHRRLNQAMLGDF